MSSHDRMKLVFLQSFEQVGVAAALPYDPCMQRVGPSLEHRDFPASRRLARTQAYQRRIRGQADVHFCAPDLGQRVFRVLWKTITARAQSAVIAKAAQRTSDSGRILMAGDCRCPDWWEGL